ncbi:MAG TPA: sensor domain-containing diguanylate cyclase [Nitrospiria bacterium]|jgi:diguanylate cyclase (GGDEF)-like protein
MGPIQKLEGILNLNFQGFPNTFFLVFILIFFITLFIGFWAGSRKGKIILNEKERVDSRLSEEKNARRSLQGQIEQLSEQNRRYLQLFITLPEAVKRLSSNLTVGEVTSSIVRLAHDLINAGQICLFLYNPDEKRLTLSLAYGLKKGKFSHLSFALGEGRIGVTGEVNIVLTEQDFKFNPQFMGKIGSKIEPLAIDLCAPIRFKDQLHGVLSVGRIKQPDQNHRTFLATVADLAAISLENAQRLDNAQLTARIDPLTKLYNRRYFQERVMDESLKCINYNFECSIFLFDIDHFKKYNDQNGHQAGDELLKKMASLIQVNTRGTSIVARYGGEEFIVLLPNTHKDQALSYAENIRRIVSTEDFLYKEKQPLGCISISGGVASFPSDARSMDEIIHMADKALYEAKDSGRNRVIPFTPKG